MKVFIFIFLAAFALILPATCAPFSGLSLPSLPGIDQDARIPLYREYDHDNDGVSSSRSLERRIGKTKNDLVSGKVPCRPITAIYARGTAGLGNLGNTVDPGRKWMAMLDKTFGGSNVAKQGVRYPALVDDYFNGFSVSGQWDVRELLQTAASKCNGTQVVLGGYDQGAMVIRDGVEFATEEEVSIVKAVVLFGNPDLDNPKQNKIPDIPPERIVNYCKPSDSFCRDFHFIPFGHAAYNEDADDGARFVAKWVRPQLPVFCELSPDVDNGRWSWNTDSQPWYPGKRPCRFVQDKKADKEYMERKEKLEGKCSVSSPDNKEEGYENTRNWVVDCMNS